jgi:hypothetical protein
VNWSQGMGILTDSVWKNGTYLTILAKTSSNFVYKICVNTEEDGFPIKLDSSNKPYIVGF